MGLALLSGLKGGFNVGELMLLLCALLFAGHILVVNHFASKTDPVALSMMQFVCCAVLSTLIALFTEQTAGMPSGGQSGALPMRESSPAVWLYAASSGQKHTDPTVARFLLSMESVFSCICGWIILHDTLSGMELVGCGLMFAAVILAQLPGKEGLVHVIAQCSK